MTDPAITSQDISEQNGTLRHRWRTTGMAAGLYLLGSIILWWGVWSSHPTTTTTCGCGDAARFLWFFEWPAYALSHGHSVFYSTWLFHPSGINLLNDTSVLALGIFCTPITLLFGPVAGMNVALTLAPVLSALSMFILLRRWIRWTPAAFFGGLVFGFSPFLVTELALNQLNIAFLAIPPLVVLALDELLIRQRRSPYRVGLCLAALLAVQFFVSTEVLLITIVFAAIAVVLILIAVQIRHPDQIAPRVRHGFLGLVTALVATTAVLAYPLWYLLRGPAHLTGPIWSNGTLSASGNTLTGFWSVGNLGQLGTEMTRFGGYQGAQLPGLGYLGLGVVLVAIIGIVVWRHDCRLLLFGALGLIAAVLSLQPGHGYWVPWALIKKLPWIGDVVEVRFTLILTLCVAAMVAITIDRFRSWLIAHHPQLTVLKSDALMAALAVLVLLPTALAMWPNVPLTAQAVVLPRWYAEVGSRLPPGQVLLSYPLSFSGLQSSQAWQAINKMSYSQAGGGGPKGQVGRAGSVKAGFTVLFNASLPLGPAPGPSAPNLAAIRAALTTWGVTTIVIPDQTGLPLYTQGRNPLYAVALFTAALGRPPDYSHSAWVWSHVTSKSQPLSMSQTGFDSCVNKPFSAASNRLQIPTCVVKSAR